MKISLKQLASNTKKYANNDKNFIELMIYESQISSFNNYKLLLNKIISGII